MHIYRLLSASNSFFSPPNRDDIVFNHQGGDYIFCEEGIDVYFSTDDFFQQYFLINNVLYCSNKLDRDRIKLSVLSMGIDIDASDIVVNSNVYKALCISSNTSFQDLFLGYYSKSRKERAYISYNFCSQKLFSVPTKRHASTIQIDNLLIAYETIGKKVSCLNALLEEVWQKTIVDDYKPMPSVSYGIEKPYALSKSFLLLLGYKEKEQNLCCSELRHYDLKGNCLWSIDILGKISTYEVFRDRLYIFSDDTVYLVDLITGNTLSSYLLDSVDVKESKGSLSFLDEKLYLGCQKTHKLAVLSLEDLSLVAEINLPENWRISGKGIEAPEKLGSKLLFPVSCVGRGVTRSGLLSLDKNEYAGEVEIEQGPDFSISLMDEKKSGEKELLISTSSNDFDDVFRFAEIHTRDEAYEHGSSIFSSYTYTEGFNGTVHFHYLGQQPDCSDVEEKLQLMEERFNKWAKETYLSADRTRDCQLISQWVRE